MRKVRKQSGSDTSTLAGILLAALAGVPSRQIITVVDKRDKRTIRFYVKDVRELAASVLSQDETKGQAKKKPRRRRK